MKYFEVHNKELPIPSFFQVYNYGGGNGDKDREIVYAELTGDTPALVNYYYINNRYPHRFQSNYFNNVARFASVGDLYNDIRNRLIKKGKIYSGYNSEKFNFNHKVFLLDSGAFSVIKSIAKEVDYDIERFNDRIIQDVIEYYNFADLLKFDIVVSFDMGGKYTKKDGEKSDRRLSDFLSKIDAEQLNNQLLDVTARYMAENPDYYPRVLATVHGETPEKYRKDMLHILALEKEYKIQFWGFALGGIASYKQVDDSWYSDISLSNIGKRGFVETITPARACKIVRELAGGRPIHALGCGGYNNIALNYYCGATSFDTASPVRRVGDGSLESTKIVFDPTPSTESFSKYFMGGINMDGTLRMDTPKYIKLNEVPDDMPLCGCAACQTAETVSHIKELYYMKEKDAEANYFSRQLIGLHAVLQHRKLCEVIGNFDSMKDFANSYQNNLTAGLNYIFERL